VVLRPLVADERAAFVAAEVASFADQQVRDAGWARAGACERAARELGPALEHALASADADGHAIWTARAADGMVLGWVWVRPGAAGPRSAFLEQLTVVAPLRGRGFGRAVLEALEDRLARDGVEVLALHVNHGNAPARRLYAAAGYAESGRDERVVRLERRLKSG